MDNTDPKKDLIIAIERKFPTDVIEDIINAIGDINYGNSYQLPDQNPLLLLIKKCDHDNLPDVLTLLLEKGANPNVIDSHSGETPLHLLRFPHCTGGNKLVQILLNMGADPYIIDKGGRDMFTSTCSEVKRVMDNYLLYKNDNKITRMIKKDSSVGSVGIAIKYVQLDRKQQFETILYVCMMDRNIHNSRSELLCMLKSAGITVHNFSNEFIEYIKNNEVDVDFIHLVLEQGLMFDYKIINFKDKKNTEVFNFMLKQFSST